MKEEKLPSPIRIRGAENLMEIAERYAVEANRLRTLAARGYTFSGRSILNTPDPTDISDRDRLAMAMSELENQHRYAAPICLAWEADCIYHANEWISNHYEEGNVDGVVFWYSEKDNESFGYPGYSEEIRCEWHALPEDMHIRDKWLIENEDRIASTEISERLQHNHLVTPLYLHWAGDANLICSVLFKHGLRTVAPDGEDDCIAVLPTRY